MKAEEYLQILTEQIRCKKARESVREEVRAHVDDQRAAYMEAGMDAELAEERAVQEMGDPAEAGEQLDRIHRPQMAWGMIALIAGLSAVGFVMQYLLQGQMEEQQILPNVERNLFFMVAGLALMIGICYVDYSRIGLYANRWIAVLCIFVLAGKAFWGLEYNGAKAWIRLPAGMVVDIRLLLGLFVPLYGAVLYRMRGSGYKAVAKAVLWMAPPVLLALGCSSRLTAWILFLACILVLSVAVSKNWFCVSKGRTLAVIWSAVLALPAAALICPFIRPGSYGQERILSMLGIGEGGRPLQAVRQLLPGLRLVGNAGGDASLSLLPDSGEYMFLATALCYGILAAAVLAGAASFLFLRFLKLSLRQKNKLGMLMGTGCAAVFLMQLLLYLLGNTGMIPAGTYCPFMTYGGSGMLVTYMLLGILLSVYRYQSVLPSR